MAVRKQIMRTRSVYIIILSLPATSFCGQFLNLDFEIGQLPIPPVPSLQQVGLVLPNWEARMGDHVLSEVGFNAIPAENGIISVYHGSSALEGMYGVYLAGGIRLETAGPVVPAVISQSGTIPEYAQSLLFRGNFSAGSLTEIRFEGELLPMTAMGSDQNIEFWGVDVGRLQGREGKLEIINYASPRTGTGGAAIDSLTFSRSAVPEPSSWILLALGGLALCWRVRGCCSSRS